MGYFPYRSSWSVSYSPVIPNPKIILTDKENIKTNVEKYLNIFKDYPYVFNLGHGVLPETNPEIIEYVINIVRNKK